MDRNMDRRKRQETARLIDGYQLLVEKEAEGTGRMMLSLSMFPPKKPKN